MDEREDAQLLREFVTRNSEDAFAELVRRHINLVYSAALRQLRNPHSAQEVAQAVFTILAQKAKTLGPQTIVTGWLYRTTRYACMTTLRAEIRRQKYEREACEALPNSGQSESPWEEIAPRLDEAMNRLGGTDRDALLLHYFEQKSFRQVGASLGTSEDAAQKRVSRALGKLRTALTRKELTISVAGLGTLLAAQSAQAASSGFVITVSATALSKGSASATSPLVKGTLKLMTWTKIKTVIAGAAALLLLGGAASTLVRTNSAAVKSNPMPELRGSWEGEIIGPARSLRIAFQFEKAGDGLYHGTMDSIDQGARGIPLTSLSYSNRSIQLELKNLKSRFNGEIAADGSEITGTFEQMGSASPLTLKRATHPGTAYAALAPSEYAPQPGLRLQGYWKGVADFAGAPNRLVLKISERTNGLPLVFLDGLDQGMRNIPAGNVSYSEPDLGFVVKGIGGRFRGALDESKDEIAGEWIMAGRSSLVVLRRADPAQDQIREGDYSYSDPGEVQGIWTGTLDVQGNILPLVFRIGKNSDGSFIGLLDSPDQGLQGLPIARVDLQNSDLLLQMPALRASYSGRLEKGKLLGTWQQGQTAYQLDCVRTNLPAPRRASK